MFWLLLSEHTSASSPSSGARFEIRKAHHPITFLQSITFLRALPELSLTCPHPFLKGLHSGFQTSEADELFGLMAAFCAQ